MIICPFLALGAVSMANHRHAQKEYKRELFWLTLGFIPPIVSMISAYKIYKFVKN
jgi:hypothetical protein